MPQLNTAHLHSNAWTATKIHEKELDKGPTKRFENTYRFCGGGINKLFLILRQDVYPNECMDSW